MGNDLVYLSTASSQTEAAALRAYLDAHGVFSHIQGEHHSSLLGPLGPFAIELRLLVAESDLDHARELLEAFYAAQPLDEDLDVGEPVDDEVDDAERPAPSTSLSPMTAGALAFIPSLGIGHVATGAPGRGFALGLIELIGIVWLLGGDPRGLVAVAGAIALDFFGATKRARDRQTLEALPPARLLKPERDTR